MNKTNRIEFLPINPPSFDNSTTAMPINSNKEKIHTYTFPVSFHKKEEEPSIITKSEKTFMAVFVFSPLICDIFSAVVFIIPAICINIPAKIIYKYSEGRKNRKARSERRKDIVKS